MTTDSSDSPIAGGFVLVVAALALLSLFWMLRTGPVQTEAWLLTLALWAFGTLIKISENEGLR